MKINSKEMVQIGDAIRAIAKGNRKEIQLESKAVVGMRNDGVGTGAELVSPSIVNPIFDGLKYESKVWAKAQVIDVSNTPGNTFIQPWFNSSLEDEPTNGTRCYFVEEGATKTQSVPQVDGLELKLGKIVVTITVTDELLEDYSRLMDYLVLECTSKLAQKIDKYAFLGVNKPINGVMGTADNATITVAADANFSEANAVSFISALHPMARNAEWYVSKGTNSNVVSKTYSATNALNLQQDNKYYLFGYPIEIIAGLTASPYHVCLADFSRYVIYHKGITIRKSSDVYFTTDQTVLKVEMRIAAGQAVNSTDLDDGSTYGWAVCPTDGEAGMSSSSSSVDSSSSDSSATSSSTSFDSSSSSSSTSSSSSSVDSSSSSSSSTSESSDSSSSSVDSSSTSSESFA